MTQPTHTSVNGVKRTKRSTSKTSPGGRASMQQDTFNCQQVTACNTRSKVHARISTNVRLNDVKRTRRWLSTTQHTSGGAVTADTSCCANCVEPSRPQQWGTDLPFFGQAGHADPLDGWRCCSQNRVMSRPIQVR